MAVDYHRSGVNVNSKIFLSRKSALRLFIILQILTLPSCMSCISRIKRSSSFKYESKQQPSFEEEKEFLTIVSDWTPPVIRIQELNFARQVVQTFYDSENSDLKVVKLPKLSVDENIWDGKVFSFNCSAGYPVHWEYNGGGSPRVKVQSYRDARKDFHEPRSYIFYSTITISYTMAKETGNYTCRGTHLPHFYNSVHVFVPGNEIFLGSSFENSKSKKDIHLATIHKHDINSEDLILTPCATSIPTDSSNLAFTLHKIDLNVNKEIDLTNSNGVTFDPKLGFSVNIPNSRKSSQLDNPYGYYMCLATDKNSQRIEEKLIVRVIPKSNDFTSEETQISFRYDKSKATISCCAKNNQRKLPLTMKSAPCDSVNDCDMLKTFLKTSSCSKKTKCTEVKDSNGGQSCATYKIRNFRQDSRILQCSVDDNSHYYFHFFYDKGFFLGEPMKEPSLPNILKLKKSNYKSNADNELASSNFKTKFFCEANSFYFANGLKWAVIPRQQTKIQFLTAEHFPAPNTIELNEADYSAIYCFAPLWDSPTQWRNVSMLLS